MGSRGCAHARPSARPLPCTTVLRRPRSIEARPRARQGGAEGGSWAVGPTPPGSAPGPTRPFPLPPSWALEAPGAPAGVHLPRCAPGRSRAGLLAAAEAAAARGRGGEQTPGSPPLPLRPSHRRPGPFRPLGDPQRVCLGKRVGLSTVSACLLPLSLPAPAPSPPPPRPPPALLAPTCRQPNELRRAAADSGLAASAPNFCMGQSTLGLG